MKIKCGQILLIVLIILFGVKQLNAQNIISSTNVSSFSTAGEGDYYLTDTDELYVGVSDGTLKPVGRVTVKGSNNGDILNWNSTNNKWEAISSNLVLGWETTGNTGTTAANFLGTTDDVRMQIRSNNLPILEFGRRQTLGLVQNFLDYTDVDQPLVYVRGNNQVSALQFAASAANFYKPMFFTTANGSFRLKGSSGISDFFEIGSAGPNNDGRLEFIIGDDGTEPIIFKRYDYRNSRFHKELFRVQGSSNSANAKTRFGININTNEVPIDTGYDDSQNAFNMANSTLQVEGSIATAITTTTANFNATEDNFTIILGGNHSVNLPNASSCSGRIYVIKNPNTFSTTISQYTNVNGVANIQTINQNSALWLQSDGANWQQINNEKNNNPVAYEKIVIWAEETGVLQDGQFEWSFGDSGAQVETGIALVENWELYGVSFHAFENGDTANTVTIDIVDLANSNNVIHTFIADNGMVDNFRDSELLATPVAIPASATLAFRTNSEVSSGGGNRIRNARIALFLRRLP